MYLVTSRFLKKAFWVFFILVHKIHQFQRLILIFLHIAGRMILVTGKEIEKIAGTASRSLGGYFKPYPHNVNFRNIFLRN